MAQEENYIAIVSERLSRPGDTRYVIIDKQTQQEVDNCNGRGYKSPQSAHKSFSFKQRQRGQGGQQSYGRTGYGQGYATRGAASQQTAVHADGAPQVTRVNSWSGYAPRRASAPRQAPVQTQQPQSYQQQPAYARPSQPQTYARPQRRYYEDVTQENTPPPPDLFDFKNK